MKRPCLSRRWLVLLAFLLLPPLFWLAVLAVTPTEWVRHRIVSRLQQKTGRSIGLGRLTVGLFGGVHLADLEIGAPNSVRNPWLKATSVRINVSVLQLLAGQVDPSEIEVQGLSLRVHRRQDGSFELADLLHAASSGGAQEGQRRGGPTSLRLRLRNATITLRDDPNRTTIEMAGVEGHATWEGHQGTIQELRGMLNGGPFELAATFNRDEGTPAFDANFRATQVAMKEGTGLLAYLVPVLSGLPDNTVDGRLDMNLSINGRGATRAMLRKSLVGHGSVELETVTLKKSKFLGELDPLLGFPQSSRIGSVKTTFAIRDSRISTDELTLGLAQMPIVLAGWTDFDGKVDYRVCSDGLTRRLPGKVRKVLADDSIDVKEDSAFRLVGTLDAMKVTLSPSVSNSLTGEVDTGSAERDRLREIGRRVRDRLLR